jgi:hypothetical protein
MPKGFETIESVSEYNRRHRAEDHENNKDEDVSDRINLKGLRPSLNTKRGWLFKILERVGIMRERGLQVYASLTPRVHADESEHKLGVEVCVHEQEEVGVPISYTFRLFADSSAAAFREANASLDTVERVEESKKKLLTLKDETLRSLSPVQRLALGFGDWQDEEDGEELDQ